jgi:hypothetical protein
MILLETFETIKTRNVYKLKSIQYFKDEDYNKARELCDEANKFYERQIIGLFCSIRTVKVGD